MNQIGGVFFGEADLENMMDMAGIEEDAAKIKETFGIKYHPQLDKIYNSEVQKQTTDKSLLRKASNYINQTQVATKKYKFKVFSNETKDVELNYNHSNLQDILTHATTPYITVSTYYRVKALESQITRLGGFNVMTFVKVFARIVDNINDKCGGLGNSCLFLEEGVGFFNIMTNFFITNGYHPVGPVTMGNEMMKQSYYKPNPLVKPAILKLDRESAIMGNVTKSAPDIRDRGSEALGYSAVAATAGKRRKSFKKKKGSKKKQAYQT
jgi:hypothetical protein